MECAYKLLLTKDIIGILDGDEELGEFKLSDETSIVLSMPYLSGPALCKLSTKFGLSVHYSIKGVNLSRWMYLRNLMEYCIENGSLSNLLSFLFNKQRFSKMFSGYSVKVIDNAYRSVLHLAMDRINGCLYFGGHELIVMNNQYHVRKIGRSVSIEAPRIKSITREYIRDISERSLVDIEEHHFDSAITKSRTLLEEVFLYVIELENEKPINSGKIKEQYKLVKSLYNMHTDAGVDKRINGLLSGLEKVISAIAEMRNAEGDAHGVGATRIGISEYHARLFVNAATTVADFILSVASNKNRKQRQCSLHDSTNNNHYV